MTPGIKLQEKKSNQIIFSIPKEIYSSKRRLEEYFFNHFDDLVAMLKEQSLELMLKENLEKFEAVILQIPNKNSFSFLRFNIVSTYSPEAAVKSIINHLLTKKSSRLEMLLNLR